MTWMLTTTGAEFDLELAAFETISTLDIASALAKINRFHGHTSRLYSVAEHSLHVSNMMEREHGITNPVGLLCGLMHDAHEAYANDLSSPLKQVLDAQTNGGWKRFEHHLQQQVLARYSLAADFTEWAEEVKRADLQMLATERRDLMPPVGPKWAILENVQTSREISLRDYEGMEWIDWRDAFLDRFGELFHAANQPQVY
jgi:hypothetical protein